MRALKLSPTIWRWLIKGANVPVAFCQRAV